MRVRTIFSMLAIASLTLLSSCNTAPKSQEDKADLQDEVQTALNKFKREDTGMDKFVNDAAGYAVFPSIGKAAWIVGGAYGKGELFEKGQMTGYTDMTQASFGFQGGAQDYMELVVFDTPQALSTLKEGKFELGANLSAVALKEGAASNTKFQNGVAVFTATKAGLMVEASVSGQKFRYSPTELQPPNAP